MHGAVGCYIIPYMKKILAMIFIMAGTNAMAFEIRSSVITDNALMSAEQAGGRCGGENVSPDLEWSGVPSDAKSLALVVHDPDAPRAEGFYHWIAVDIPPSVRAVAKGEKFQPPARELPGDYGVPGYNGPCPPAGHGAHHYHFTVYALDVSKIDIPSGAEPFEAAEQIRSHSVGQATLVGLFENK